MIFFGTVSLIGHENGKQEVFDQGVFEVAKFQITVTLKSPLSGN